MKLLRVGAPGAERPVVGVGEDFFDAGAVGDFTPEFWAGEGPARIEAALRDGALPRTDPGDERVGPPVVRPSAVICIGQNYAAHAAESGAEPPTRPIIFLKTPNTVAGPDDDVVIPSASLKSDWEVELGVVIGRPAWRCADEQAAAECIGGYVLANDLSEREWQLEISGGQWSKGKCVPGYLPVGPWVVTPDEFDPSDVRLRSWVNGEPRQDSRTSDMIFSPAEIVRDLSQVMRLEPGDIISTGTPEGVALSGRFPYLVPGDVVDLEIEGLGHQRQTYVAEEH